MNREKAKNIIFDKVKGFPTLPDVVHKVLPLMEDESSSAKELADLISYDQAISSRLLKVSNSAYYGFMRKIATVKHAIVVLGLQEVKSLTLGIAVLDTMKGVGSGTSLNGKELWMHSIGCAIAGQIIAKLVGGVKPEVIFTASLLHDIGKLVLDIYFGKEYVKIVEKTKENGLSMAEAEKEVMNVDHADVGGWICETWKFPPALTLPIANHHHLEGVNKDYLRLTLIVHLADILCKQARIGNSGDNNIPVIHPLVQSCLKLTKDDLGIIVENLKQEEDKVKSFLSAIQ